VTGNYPCVTGIATNGNWSLVSVNGNMSSSLLLDRDMVTKGKI